jgi:lysophospholipase L1-like esterase
MKRIIRIAAALILAALVAVPMFAAARGKADFTRFVAIGDSYGAGVESGSLNLNHQQFSWPAIIARQVGLKVCSPSASATEVCFAEPLVSFPGIGNELQLVSITGTIAPASGTGAPIMTTFGRPYNNLAIPGANVNDTITLKGLDPATSTAKAYAQFILRGLGTEADQALAQNPTFIAVWIGGNDLLGAVLAGTPALITPVANFTTAYNALLDKLTAGAPNAGIIVGNIPTNPLAVPYVTTVPRVLVDPSTRQPILVGGAPVPLIADLGGGNIGPLPAGSFVLLPAASKIATGQGLPPQLKAIPPFNQLPNTGVPLADTDVLTPTEVTAIQNAAVAFNDVIAQAAASRNIPVADIKGLFDRLAAGQEFVGPLALSSAFVTGGAFSLDGFHMTDIGYTLFANEYIKTINNSYGTKIPLASVGTFLQNNDPSQVGSYNDLSPEAAATILSFVPQAPAPASRRRGSNH